MVDHGGKDRRSCRGIKMHRQIQRGKTIRRECEKARNIQKRQRKGDRNSKLITILYSLQK